ncbi:MAG: NAD-dependent deacylase [Deltaproteobacteria bacterium]|nr:NAD-dependent deacylase [Deltaproteobacteria bacterium]
MKTSIEKAASLIRDARKTVVFTGAGVSAESGISTYRGEGGTWKRYDPNKYADINNFFQNPTYYWSFFRDVRYPMFADAKPNPAHFAIADLEKQGKLDVVVTQNIDGLHQAAGSTNVLEIHGNTRVINCLSCHADFGFQEIYQQVLEELPPTCKKCGGTLKPGVVFFGDQLPAGVMEQADKRVADCDLLLVIGSTLQIYPAASLPLIAKRNSAKVIIVNVGETAMEEMADVRIDARAGEVLPQIVQLI